MNWSVRRSRELTTKILSLATRPEIRYTFLPSERVQNAYQNGYFPSTPDIEAELAAFAPSPFTFVSFSEDTAIDILIVSVHGGADEADTLWNLRNKFGEDTLIVAWLWDNHVSYLANMDAALAADLVFVSHAYLADYVHTPASLVAGHVAACSAQWTHSQVSDFFAQSLTVERRHKLLVNYVMQEPASSLRKRVLEEYRDGLTEADVFLMTKEERARYFELSRRERFMDWARYKATVIVPMGRDVSTRVFDALLTGQVIIVPEYIDDFNTVIPEDAQKELGIIRVQSLELDEVQKAASTALDLFDSMGIDGIRVRHNYALQSHMLVNRIEQMLYVVWLIADGQWAIECANAHHGVALYMRRNTTG